MGIGMVIKIMETVDPVLFGQRRWLTHRKHICLYVLPCQISCSTTNGKSV